MHYETPAAVSLHTRYWTEAVDYGKFFSVPKGGQAFFGEGMGNGGKTRFVTDSSHVDFDVRDGMQEVSTLVHRGNVAQPLNVAMLTAGRFTSFVRAFPLGEEYGLVSADQLLARGFGENPYQPLTQKERARRLATDIIDEAMRRAIRTQELLAWQMIKTGKMDLIIGTTSTDEQIDTKRLSTHAVTIGTTWATASTDIIADFDTAGDLVAQDSGHAMDGCILGSNGPKYLANNTAIKAFAAMAGANGSGMAIVWYGANTPARPQFAHLVANGLIPICELITYKGRRVTCFTYDGGYKASGTFTPFVAADQAIWFSSQARCDRYFGPQERLPMTQQERADYTEVFGFAPEATPVPANVGGEGSVVVPAEFYPDVYRESNDAKAFTVRLQYAPMFITTDTNAFVYAADVTP